MINKNIYFLSLAILCGVIGVSLFPRWTIDDAYITFRYAENLATCGALTWNIGEPPVEGYTGVALPAVLAMLHKLGLSTIIASKAIGLVAYFGGAFFVWLILHRLHVRDWQVVVTLLYYFCAPFLYVHAWSGLETLAFSTTILACIGYLDVCLNAAESSARKEMYLALLLLLAGLIRPEGVVLAMISLMVLAYAKVRAGHPKWSSVFRSVFYYGLPAMVYFGWRWKYYGELLPNTFYAKVYDGIYPVNPSTVSSLLAFIIDYGLRFLIIALALHLAGHELSAQQLIFANRSVITRIRLLFIASIVFLSIITVQYLRSNLVQNLSYRFFVPYYVLFLIGFGCALARGSTAFKFLSFETPARPVQRLAVFIAVGMMIWQAIASLSFYKKEAAWVAAYQRLLNEEHIPIGFWLKEHLQPWQRLIVVEDAGAIPYISGLQTVDFGRLNDRYLARMRRTPIEVANYFFAQNADALVFNSTVQDQVQWSSYTDHIPLDPRMMGYTLMHKYSSKAWSNYYEFVYLRNDLIYRDEAR